MPIESHFLTASVRHAVHSLLQRRTNFLDPDTFSIDSKDSCRPEKCDSPSVKTRKVVSRNGQGTTVDARDAELQASKESTKVAAAAESAGWLARQGGHRPAAKRALAFGQLDEP